MIQKICLAWGKKDVAQLIRGLHTTGRGQLEWKQAACVPQSKALSVTNGRLGQRSNTKEKSTTGHRRWGNWHELVKHAKNGLAND